MKRLTIPHDALVFVGDGQKALFLRNGGDEKFPNLTTERVFTDVNPPTREQGTDRPDADLSVRARTVTAVWKRQIGMSWKSFGLSTMLRLKWNGWFALKT